MASFTTSNQSQTDQYFSTYLLYFVNFFPICLDVPTAWWKQLWIKSKQLIMRTNKTNDCQKWYQQPRHLARHVSGLVALSTYWLQLLWKTRLKDNWHIYQSISASLTMANKSKNYRYFSSYLLTLLKIKEHQFKANHLIVQPKIYEMIANSEINGFGTFQVTFMALLHAQLTGYSYSDEQGWWKIINYKISSASFVMANKSQNDHFWRSPLTFD